MSGDAIHTILTASYVTTILSCAGIGGMRHDMEIQLIFLERACSIGTYIQHLLPYIHGIEELVILLVGYHLDICRQSLALSPRNALVGSERWLLALWSPYPRSAISRHSHMTMLRLTLLARLDVARNIGASHPRLSSVLRIRNRSILSEMIEDIATTQHQLRLMPSTAHTIGIAE